MKKCLLLSAALCLLTLHAAAQTCLSGGIIFSTQGQIDSFPINYPGCTQILGDVSIGAGITNLNGLSALTSIGGGLSINNTDLTSLNGLSALTSVGNELYIDYNGSLTSLAGLDALNFIGGG